MATVSELGETWNTTACNKTVTATPAVNDLIVVVHGISGAAGGDDTIITDDQSGTYTQIVGSTGGGTAGLLRISIRTALIPSATSTVFTATNTGDTGGGLTVLKVTGMTRTGASAALQNVPESSQSESPVVITFPSATLTGNPVILGCFGEDNPAALGPPTGFSETTDTGYATPTTGIHVCFVSSGQTSSAYTYASGAFTDHNEVGVELDTTTPTQTISPDTISPTEAVPSLSSVNFTLYPAVIVSTDVVNSAQVNFGISLDTIPPTEAVPALASVNFVISPDGIDPTEAWGTVTVTVSGGAQTITPYSITPTEAFGTLSVNFIIYPDNIAPTEAVPSPQVNFIIYPDNVAPTESVSSPQVNFTLYPDDIDPTEVVSNAQVNFVISPDAIAPTEAVQDLASVNFTFYPDNISPTEALG